MRLRPLRFLWKQFNGPQITAIMTAIFRYIQSSLNTTIIYLTEFTIDSATDDHLTLIGMCMGIARPITTIRDISNFIFTAAPLQEREYGVSEAPGPDQVGGHFTDLDDDIRGRHDILLPERYFRFILQECAKTRANLFSPVHIDEMLNGLWEKLFPGRTPWYQFSWTTEPLPAAGLAINDMRIDLGDIMEWRNIEDAEVWRACIETIINQAMAPTAQCAVVFS